MIHPLEAALGTEESAPDIIAGERAAAVEVLQLEIMRSIQFVQAERIAALEHLTKERVAALTVLHDYTVEERKALIGAMKELSGEVVDQALLRAAQLVVAVLIAFFVGAVVLLFITRRVFAARPPASAK